MSDVAIRVEGLGKQYRIGVAAERHRDLRDALSAVLLAPFRNFARLRNASRLGEGEGADTFWALKDVSFEVKQGELVGIIGRNGAGKSTLLKILSRITDPTTGRALLRGHVGALLEVGTGFNSELTGRENVYLNGSILGMDKKYIDRKFDEIVEFSGVAKFIDTPVKRYSSGMYLRLAFSVAAHLEPEILVVDEVLAVGDTQFQNKCLGKMEEVGRDGRTVLFVSHNMAMVSNLCQRGIVLEAGSLAFQGPVSEAVLHYYQRAGDVRDGKHNFESDNAALIRAGLIVSEAKQEVTVHDDVTISMSYRIKRAVDGLFVPNFHFYTADGTYAFVSGATGVAPAIPGEYTAECRIPGNMLNEGAYFVGVAITTYYNSGSFTVEFFDRNALTFNVIDPMDERSNRYGYAGAVPGVVRPQLNWTIRRAAE